MKSILTLSAALIFVYASCVNISRNNTNTISGIVTNVSTGGLGGKKDITIELKANDTLYYINRGLDKLTLQELRQSLVNSQVSITYAKSTFQPTFKHITEITRGEQILYTEYGR